jgi:hypothetical protein
MAQQNTSLLHSLNFNIKMTVTHTTTIIIIIIINSPSAKCVSVGNKVCKEVGIFRTTIISLKKFALICDIFISPYL